MKFRFCTLNLLGLMSLNEEMAETPNNGGSRDLRQRRTLHHAFVCHLCLGTFGNMLYLNPCYHNFCFSCTRFLLETKAECPLCKQPFRSVYNPTKKAMKSSSESERFLLSAKCAKEEHPLFLTKKNIIDEDNQITEQQPDHGFYHCFTMRKKEISEELCPGMVQNKTSFNYMPGLMKTGDYDPECLRYQATLRSLPWSDMTDAALMLIAFGIVLFICLYIYLSLGLLPEH